MSSPKYEKVHALFKDIMAKIQKPAAGLFDYPSLSTTYGDFYAACIFTWDSHHMTLKFAAEGQPEQMKYYEYTILKFQRADGFVPCCCNSVDGGGIAPAWHAQPWLCQNAAIYLELTGDKTVATDLYPKLEAYLNYWLRNFKAPYGLYRWADTPMSGFDNEITGSIFPKDSICSPDISSLLYLECRAMAYLSRQLGKTDDIWESRAQQIAEAVNKMLWSEELGTYASYNLLDDVLQTSWNEPNDPLTAKVGRYAYISCPSLLVLFAGIAPKERAERMIKEYVLSPKHFRSRFGIRSLSASSEYYNNARWGNPARSEGNWHNLTASNWQGPVWIPLNWFVFHALLRYGFTNEAEKLADDTIELVANSFETIGCMRENFNAETGEPLYADDFASWNILADVMPGYLEGKAKLPCLFPDEK